MTYNVLSGTLSLYTTTATAGAAAVPADGVALAKLVVPIVLELC